MKSISNILIFSSLMTTVTFSHSQQNDLSSLNDDFNKTSSLSNWQSHHQTEGWPQFICKVEIDEAESILYIEPSTSAWYGEFHRSPYYFKKVKGNFTITTKLKVTGLKTLSPTKGFSLAGLMLRSPRPISISKFKKGYENWMFLSTGSATKKGKPQFESKNTVNGMSKLKVFPSKQGWVYLSISRIDHTFYQSYRYEGEQQWILLRVIERPEMPDELQAGMLAYSGFWNLMKWYFSAKKFNSNETKNKADLIAKFDFTHFLYINDTNVITHFKVGFYNKPMPAELKRQLRLDEI